MTWTFFFGDSRHAFRDRLGLDDATWARSRGWALGKAQNSLVNALKGQGPQADLASRMFG
jgi:aminoglycoside phosphotransferase (APT) family kinase protein